MSEQKYYVRLNRCAYIEQKEGCIYHDVIWIDNDWEFVKEDSRQSFTKSELTVIMNGALYKQTLSKDCIPPDHVCYGSGEEIVSEWINPLIELVPVEDVEK